MIDADRFCPLGGLRCPPGICDCFVREFPEDPLGLHPEVFAVNGVPAEPLPAPNYYAPDGWRYGVMFGDGSVASYWNGRTQREHASEFAEDTARTYAPDRITLARRRPPGPWERVE